MGEFRRWMSLAWVNGEGETTALWAAALPRSSWDCAGVAVTGAENDGGRAQTVTLQIDNNRIEGVRLAPAGKSQ